MLADTRTPADPKDVRGFAMLQCTLLPPAPLKIEIRADPAVPFA
jgi:hypothetical protein